MKQNRLKQDAGVKAVDFIKSGMTIGLGTGSTVTYLVEELGKRVQSGQLDVDCVATSQRTFEQASNLGIKMHALSDVNQIDLTIDGADEIDLNFQGIKGGGAAQTYEKIVALNSQKNIWIVDESKMVDQLGAFPLPLEVVPFGWKQLFDRLHKENLNPHLRCDEKHQPILTDMNNYVIDLYLQKIMHPHLLANWLNQQTGIIEHGLFLDLVNTVIVGRLYGPEAIENVR
ncbi:ribose-5-phosphate isomerase RpiA [Bombilactobacillus thymidiniphilus]|uniref:Ribose-5-phosphate isomerase A n=1 Tax=Bombilactobacillus thymidiniphilus TaxID=2923363 RepID=A0ABY4PF61_9LACO|nr:ribose-5-phosphate isomerase RpiA [Bombilactobacillus thymidiniphilus]UQS83952.1 ribose-5-phosphate isomerase RpiA [Bombilactobacillus thymidiniphilus]